MKAFVGKSGFVLDHALPKLGRSADDVLIKVSAFGINRPDLIQHTANYPPPKGVTDVLGLELSGQVVEANDKALLGKEVCALVPGGAYSEYCLAKWGTCLPIPFANNDKERFVKAAALPENVFTVWRNVFRDFDFTAENKIKSDRKSMLFHGGSSGIGSTAITLAKAFGVNHVVTTAGSVEKCNRCLEFGADVALNYKDVPDWTKDVGKVDLVLDMVGGEYMDMNLKVLNTNGKLVIIGFLQGPVSTVNMTRVMLKSLNITGSVLRSQPQAFKEILCEEIKQHIWPLIEKNEVKLPAHISHIYQGIDQVEDALNTMTSSEHIGKIVVQVEN